MRTLGESVAPAADVNKATGLAEAEANKAEGLAEADIIIAQLPRVLESLTGIKFEKLLAQVPALKKAMEKDVPPDTGK